MLSLQSLICHSELQVLKAYHIINSTAITVSSATNFKVGDMVEVGCFLAVYRGTGQQSGWLCNTGDALDMRQEIPMAVTTTA